MDKYFRKYAYTTGRAVSINNNEIASCYEWYITFEKGPIAVYTFRRRRRRPPCTICHNDLLAYTHTYVIYIYIYNAVLSGGLCR